MEFLGNEIEYINIIFEEDVIIKLKNGVLIIKNDFGNFITVDTDNGCIRLSEEQGKALKEVIKKFEMSGISFTLDETLIF